MDRKLGRLILLAAALAAAIPAQVLAEVKDTQDRFTGKREITYTRESKRLGDPTFIAGIASLDGQIRADFAFITGNLTDRRTGTAWKYLRCHNVNWLVDGSPFPLNMPKHDGQVIRGGVIEIIRQDVTISQMEKIAAATTAEYRLCSDEGSLTPADLQGIREIIALSKGSMGNAEVQPPVQQQERATPSEPAMKYRPKF